MARIKIGDIVEIPLTAGFGYAIVSHKHDKYGHLLRVFEGTWEYPLDRLEELLDRGEQFMCFFPLGAAVRRKIVSIAGNLPVPESMTAFPIFRSGLVNTNRKVDNWFLWDGEKSWRIGDLKPEQRKLPVRGIWNDTLLVDRIESGYRPENDVL
jgi:hypothetical protein